METQERDNKKTKRFSAGSGVERMIPLSAKRRFESVLKAEQLADIPSSFRDPAFCDEVPLYSRYKQVNYLTKYGDVDLLLLELSLDYLKRIVAETPATKSRRFLAVTIVRDDDNEYIVPYIFICNSNVKSRLKGLHLSLPSSTLGKYIQSLLRQSDHSSDYRVLDDRSTVPESVRVFVSYKTPPDRLVSLDECMNNRSEIVGRK
jgi:hypothetical protein